MPRRLRTALAWALAATASICLAQPPVRSAQGSPAANEAAAWSFNLPTLDGDRFIRSSEFSGPVLVNFWGRDCAPCIAELPRLEAFARVHPEWTVLLVATDAPEDARRFLRQHGIALPVLRGGLNVAGLMRSAGNRFGGLPFSAVLDGAHLCATKLGELLEPDLNELARVCPARNDGIP